jgi:hypothetical protein
VAVLLGFWSSLYDSFRQHLAFYEPAFAPGGGRRSGGFEPLLGRHCAARADLLRRLLTPGPQLHQGWDAERRKLLRTGSLKDRRQVVRAMVAIDLLDGLHRVA